jgi:hypothetical protein
MVDFKLDAGFVALLGLEPVCRNFHVAGSLNRKAKILAEAQQFCLAFACN